MLANVLMLMLILPWGLDTELAYEFDRLYLRRPVIKAAEAQVPAPAVDVSHFDLPVNHGGLVAGWYFMDPRFPADGPQHTGVDLACLPGEPIYAPADGVVQFAAWNGDCGKEVGIRHGGYMTYYCHLSSYGATGYVSRGTVIGYCGSTGLSTGEHLHYEVHFQGVPVDPFSLP